jgi:hypothetical protein
MSQNWNRNGARPKDVSPVDLEQERHHVHESRVYLVSLAQELGLAVPRDCCPHRGAAACLLCASDWLVAYARLASGAILTSRLSARTHYRQASRSRLNAGLPRCS